MQISTQITVGNLFTILAVTFTAGGVYRKVEMIEKRLDSLEVWVRECVINHSHRKDANGSINS